MRLYSAGRKGLVLGLLLLNSIINGLEETNRTLIKVCGSQLELRCSANTIEKGKIIQRDRDRLEN